MIESLERMTSILKIMNTNHSDEVIPDEIFEMELRTLKIDVLKLYEEIDEVLNSINSNNDRSSLETLTLLQRLDSKYDLLLKRVMQNHDILIKMYLVADDLERQAHRVE